MNKIETALSYFAKSEMIDMEEFDSELWITVIGPGIALLHKHGLAYARYSNEDDYPIAGDLTVAGKEALAKLNLN